MIYYYEPEILPPIEEEQKLINRMSDMDLKDRCDIRQFNPNLCDNCDD